MAIEFLVRNLFAEVLSILFGIFMLFWIGSLGDWANGILWKILLAFSLWCGVFFVYGHIVYKFVYQKRFVKK